MARDASAFDISTKPKPRGRPVSRSVISETFSTVPCWENNVRTASSVAVKGRFPTYSLVTEVVTHEKKETRQITILPPGSSSFTRVRDWPQVRPRGHTGAKTDKPKDYEPLGRLQV